MRIQDIIRAWKDADYRQSLSEQEQTLVPTNPVGDIALTDEDLGMVVGGFDARANVEIIFNTQVPVCPCC